MAEKNDYEKSKTVMPEIDEQEIIVGFMENVQCSLQLIF